MDDNVPSDGGGWLPQPSDSDDSPEGQELAAKREEMQRLHEEAIHLEEKREMLRNQLDCFNLTKLLRLGRLYARVDELELRIAELELLRDPENPVLQRRVQEALVRAARSLEASREAEEMGPPETVCITEEIKELYREAARLMHPDLGRTPEARDRRHTFMVALNSAYLAADVERIKDLRARWEATMPPPEESTTATELVRVIRVIARLRKTVHRIDKEVVEIRVRPDCKLMVRVHQAEVQGRDLLAVMEERVRTRIEDREARLRDLEQDDAA